MHARTALLVACLALALCACDGAPVPGTNTSPASGSPDPQPGGGAAPEELVVATVYTSDYDFDGDLHLYAANRSGDFLNLSHSLGNDHNVAAFRVSPDNRWVAFVTDAGIEPGLYVTPTNRDDPQRVSAPEHHAIDEVSWSPDSTLVAFRAGASSPQLHVVAPDGTGWTNLSGAIGEVIRPVRWSPDGAWLAYHSDKAAPGGGHDLYVIRPDGSDETRLTVTGPSHFRWSPVESSIAFRSDEDVPGTFELYVVDLDQGGPRVRLSTAGATGAIRDMAWAPDGARLLYRRDDPATVSKALFLVSKRGGDAHDVSGMSVATYLWSPDGTRFAFRAGFGDLHVADDAGPPVPVASANTIPDYAWSLDGEQLAYRAADGATAPHALFVVDPAGGTAPIEISDPGEDVHSFLWVRADGTPANELLRAGTLNGEPRVASIVGDVSTSATEATLDLGVLAEPSTASQPGRFHMSLDGRGRGRIDNALGQILCTLAHASGIVDLAVTVEGESAHLGENPSPPAFDEVPPGLAILANSEFRPVTKPGPPAQLRALVLVDPVAQEAVAARELPGFGWQVSTSTDFSRYPMIRTQEVGFPDPGGWGFEVTEDGEIGAIRYVPLLPAPGEEPEEAFDVGFAEILSQRQMQFGARVTF